nr:DUF1127 domain-containing protein [Maritimibacter dapengensis]
MGLAHRRRFSPLTLVARARAARRERRALAKLDDHLLDDIGLTRRAAWSEAKRPFWELPSRHHW